MNRIELIKEILEHYSPDELQTVYDTYHNERRDGIFIESNIEPDEIPIDVCLSSMRVLSIWAPNRFQEYTETEALNIFFEQMTPEFLNLLGGIHIYQEGSPSDKDFIPMNKLPDWIQTIVKEINALICSHKYLERFAEQEKYKKLCTPEILQELIKTYQNKEWVGRMYLRKSDGGKSFMNPRIWITYAKQHWDFFDKDPVKPGDDNEKEWSSNLLLFILKEIEKELKPKVDKLTKPHGLEFVLDGDPGDGIHEFQFNVSNELSDIIWKHSKNEKMIQEGEIQAPFDLNDLMQFGIYNP